MKKWIRRMWIAIAAVAVYALAVNFFVIGVGKKHIVPPQETGTGYDCILVLGCQVIGSTPSDMLRDRLDRAIELYKAGVSDTLLMSGDRSADTSYDEVTVMRDYAVQNGVPQDAILLDPTGYSTYESMANATQTFRVDRFLIVTQPYHLYRAVFVARGMGADAVGTAAMPNRYGMMLYNTVREMLARNKDFLLTAYTKVTDAVRIGGKTRGVQTREIPSEKYSDADIHAAIQATLKDFRKGSWKGCTMREIYYAGDACTASYSDFQRRYSADEVIVLLSTFDVGRDGGNGSLETNTTYEGWNWILVRSDGGKWKHVDHGY